MMTYDDTILYQDNESLREIFIPEECEKIGDNAFKNCTALETVIMTDSVTEIGRSAFENCHSLKEIKISRRLKSLGTGAFKNCDRLRELTLPAEVSVIDAKSVSEVIPTGNYCNLYFETVLNSKHAEQIIERCRKNVDGTYFADSDVLKNLGLNSLKQLNTPVFIDDRMGTLLFVDHPATDVNPDVKRKVISWEIIPEHFSEKQGILRKIKEQSDNYYNAGDEQAWIVQQLSRDMNRLPSFLSNRFYELCLCTLEFSKDGNVIAAGNKMLTDGDVTCKIRVIRTHAFFLSARRIMYNGKNYYIYSRNYLLGKLVPRYTAAGVGDGIYDRKDMAIFDENGIIEDRELAEHIYAKYKLFSSL